MSFGVDADGNYGYIKAGADTVTPFKNGPKRISIGTVSIYTTSVDVKKYTDNWTKLDNSNFAFGNISLTVSGSVNTAVAGSGAFPTVTSNVTFSYNKTTGILSVKNLNADNSTIGVSSGGRLTIEIYLYE